MAAGYWSPLAIAVNDGPTITTTGAATCLPTTAKFNFGANSIVQGSALKITAGGRISCAVTTPGTARLDVRYGGTIIYDSGALNLNVVAKTTVPWFFSVILICRTGGATGNFFPLTEGFTSQAVVGAPLPTVGGNGTLLCPVGTPAVGGNVDLTAASSAFDVFYTQTVATGSFTVHTLLLESASLATT